MITPSTINGIFQNGGGSNFDKTTIESNSHEVDVVDDQKCLSCDFGRAIT